MIRRDYPSVDDLPPDPGASFPLDALPPSWRAMLEAGSSAQGVDPAFWAVPSFAILAGCVGATRWVRVAGAWREPCIVWAAVVAPSGAGKSPPLRDLLAPVRERDRRLHERTLAMQQAHDAEKAVRAKGEPDLSAIAQLAAVVGDVTLEALAQRLADNPRGLLLGVDELAGWLRSFDRYRKGGDEQAWLSLWGGDPVRVDRKTSGSVRVERPACSVVGTIQPSIAARYLVDPERRASGLAARILLAAPPLKAARLARVGAPAEVGGGWGRLCRSLLDLELSDGEPVEVRFAEDAWGAFQPWHDANGDACCEAGRCGDDDRAAVLAKLRAYVPRIALLLALVRAAEAGTASLVRHVEAQDVRGAIAIVDWFDGQAQALYAEWDARGAADRREGEPGAVRRLADRLADILRGGARKTSELHDATGRNHSRDEMRAALALIGAKCERLDGQRGRKPDLWSLGETGG